MMELQLALVSVIQEVLENCEDYTEEERNMIDDERLKEIAFNVVEDEEFSKVLKENVYWYLNKMIQKGEE